ncbi:gluconokinase [Clostridium tetanomorphum]|nr:gluconokinase [Clostridium tetanomorphum]KAJ51065.1 gluconate kinase [Clostridium tetanomorphum DSM 665]KAJ51619.1 gluconate kinase [Clostridium tetanomorphum DSM 665]MBP1864509.1 gluconokinase [Clostridium tetanomorphum]NRS82960.1 gluconokinase [Clostridium tetanomorphum]NRZ98944.1 gluconokinase [Clostridium tetanomorphum]
MKKYYIGIDIGTTSTKSILFDVNGKVVNKVTKGYPIYSDKPDFKEQDPEEIFQAVLYTLESLIKESKVSSEQIQFISFSSMMHSIIAVDQNCKPLTKCIIWADNRSREFVKKFKKAGKGHELYLRTGTPCHPMSPFYKLLWLKYEQNEIFNKSHKFISIKEYIFYKLFNQYIVDYSIASATGMFNIFKLEWDKEALGILDIDKDKLSKPVSTIFQIKNINKEYAQITGLNEDTVFVVGASDGCLANLGSKAIKKGIAAATIGTSGAVRVVFDKPVTDPKERVFCYVLTEDKYVVGGAINNGGIVYRWFKENFAEIEDIEAKKLNKEAYDILNEYIEEIEPGSKGLMFLPFLSGERAPYWDASLRGAFLGISDIHTKKHMTRALIEGICFDMNEVFQAIKDLVGEVQGVYANGGFTRSEEWIKILADIMDTNIRISENYESSCLGAVMLGMLSIGITDNLDRLDYMIDDFANYNVRKQNLNIYKDLENIYKASVQALKPINESLITFQK